MTHPISVQICLHKPLFSKKNCAQWKIRIPFCNCLKKERFQYNFIETFIMISLLPCWCPKTKKKQLEVQTSLNGSWTLFLCKHFFCCNKCAKLLARWVKNMLYTFTFVEQVPSISGLKTYRHSTFPIYDYQYTKKI